MALPVNELLSASHADPNWFLSTAAQSAAALVAIIGGFLVSRVITISSERGAMGAELEHLPKKKAGKQGLLSTLGTEVNSGAESAQQALRREIADIEVRQEHLQVQLQNRDYISDIRWAAISLCYFAIIGVVLPLWFLPVTPETFESLSLKCWLFVGFLSGVLALAGTIWRAIRRIPAAFASELPSAGSEGVAPLPRK